MSAVQGCKATSQHAATRRASGLLRPASAVPWLAPRVLKQAPEGFTALDYAKKRYGTVMYYFGLLVSLFYLFIYMVAEVSDREGAAGCCAASR